METKQTNVCVAPCVRLMPREINKFDFGASSSSVYHTRRAVEWALRAHSLANDEKNKQQICIRIQLGSDFIYTNRNSIDENKNKENWMCYFCRWSAAQHHNNWRNICNFDQTHGKCVVSTQLYDTIATNWINVCVLCVCIVSACRPFTTRPIFTSKSRSMRSSQRRTHRSNCTILKTSIAQDDKIGARKKVEKWMHRWLV